jgi:hypothetical protein
MSKPSEAPFISHKGVRVFLTKEGEGVSPFWFSLSGQNQEIVGSEAMQFSIVYLPYRFFDGSGKDHTMDTPIADRLASAKTALTAAIEAGFDLTTLCGMGKDSTA